MLAISAIFLRKDFAQKFATVTTNEDRYYLPPPSWLRIFAMGYNEAVADSIWATTLIYFGGKRIYYEKNADGSITPPETAQYTTNHLKAVTSLDPRFKAAYLYGATLTMFHHGTITKETVKMSIDLLKTGLENFPNDGEIAFNLGFFYYSELPVFISKKDQPKEYKAAINTGIKIIRRSTLLEGAPSYASSMAGNLLEKEGLENLMIEHLKAMLTKETNPAIRKRMYARLSKRISAAEQISIQKISRLYDDWKEHYVFAPFDLYLIISPSVDLTPASVASPLLAANKYLGLSETDDQ